MWLLRESKRVRQIRKERCVRVVMFYVVLLGAAFIHKDSETEEGVCEHGWVETQGCTPYGFPVNSPNSCKKPISSTSGFCWCTDTTIAAPSACGHESFLCADACRDSEKLVHGTPLPDCQGGGRREQGTGEEEKAKDCLLEARPALTAVIGSKVFRKSIGITRRKLPDKGRRGWYRDFVAEKKRMNAKTFAVMKKSWEDFKVDDGVPKYPQGEFKGRGAVVYAYKNNDQQQSHIVAIRLLRKLGFKLPIEMWYTRIEDMPSCFEMKEMGEELGMTFRSIERENANAGGVKSGEFDGLVAATLSSFEEVLLVDPRVLFLRNPAFLFDDRRFQKYGHLLWRGAVEVMSSPDLDDILGINSREVLESREADNGVMLLSKTKVWEALMMSTYAAFNSIVFERLLVIQDVNNRHETISTALIRFMIALGHSIQIDHHKCCPMREVGVFGSDLRLLSSARLAYGPDGQPLYLKSFAHHWGRPLPANFDQYRRRFEGHTGEAGLDDVHNVSIINDYVGFDLEQWAYQTAVEHISRYCDKRNAIHWDIGVGPFVGGKIIKPE